MMSSEKHKIRECLHYYVSIVLLAIILIFTPILILPGFVYKYFKTLVCEYKDGIKVIANFIKINRRIKNENIRESR